MIIYGFTSENLISEYSQPAITIRRTIAVNHVLSGLIAANAKTDIIATDPTKYISGTSQFIPSFVCLDLSSKAKIKTTAIITNSQKASVSVFAITSLNLISISAKDAFESMR